MLKDAYWWLVFSPGGCIGSAAENVGTAAKPNGIMHEPVRANRANTFSNNSLSILSYRQTAVDISSQTAGPSTFELSNHDLIGTRHEDWNFGSCLYGFKLLKSRVIVLFIADISRVLLICFRVHYWYFGHCISYAVLAFELLGAAVSCYLSVTNPLAARRDALQSTVIRLREGFRRKDQNSSANSSKGCGSSVKHSSSADDGHIGNVTVSCTRDGNTWNNIEGINNDKSIDSRRPSLALRNSCYRSVVQEPEVGSSYVDRNLEHNSSLVVFSTSGIESQGGDSSTSTSANQQILDLNLALAF
ncbi:hypothetical protein T459_28830 [Capsicum annuum]|uniref:Calpain-type cysteine protease DEK1-like n=1 Tax=Capsicum annuum TaxID=4072 RepID=A0A2G2YHV9_CAPAN|nr:hypothetical protein T459_28830 [Capsicum annuum]